MLTKVSVFIKPVGKAGRIKWTIFKPYEHDWLATFDVVLANPPYSIKQWNCDAWQSDVWGRNFLGTPPQGRADYTFFQRILRSMDPQTGRCAILFPHGVLFCKEEADMRKMLIEPDLMECVLGLGPNLFYNSPMEACIVICCSQKPPERQGKTLFIDAINEVTWERATSYLTPEHQQQIVGPYQTFLESEYPGFARVAVHTEMAQQGYSLSIPLYVKRVQHENGGNGDDRPLPEFITFVDPKGKWTALRSIGMVEAQRTIGDQTSVETRYYISSLPGDAVQFAQVVRSHWEIENKVHWVLDVAF